MGIVQESHAVLFGSGDRESGGGGSTIETLLQCSALGLIAVKFDVVITNNPEGRIPGFYERIAKYNRDFNDNIDILTINSSSHPALEGEVVEAGAQTLAEAQACADVIDEHGSGFYVLAGWLKRVKGELLKRKGINSHPGPLASNHGIAGVDTSGLIGIQAQKKVLDEGFPYSAHSVNRVTAEYDAGDLIAWRPVLVLPGDTPQTLFDRVQHVEKASLPMDIESFARNL